MLKKILISLCLISSISFAKNEININVNDETLELGIDIHMNEYYDLDNRSNYYFGVNFIATESNEKEDLKYMGINFRVENSLDYSDGIIFGMGIKTVAIDSQDNDNFAAIALAVHSKFILSEYVSITGNAYYSPKVLGFFEAKRLWGVDVNARYHIVNNALVYIGARQINIGYEDKDNKNFDKSIFCGFKFLF